MAGGRQALHLWPTGGGDRESQKRHGDDDGGTSSGFFLGKQTTFPSGAKAQPVDLPKSSPAREQFYTKVTGKTAAQVKAAWPKIVFTGKERPPKEVASTADMKNLSRPIPTQSATSRPLRSMAA